MASVPQCMSVSIECHSWAELQQPLYMHGPVYQKRGQWNCHFGLKDSMQWMELTTPFIALSLLGQSGSFIDPLFW